MDIHINEASSIPVYEQIVIQIVAGVREKRLAIGDALPTIRQLAHDLELTTVTVSRAYQILERGRIITTGGRRGTHIHEQAIDNAGRFLREQTETLVREFIHTQLKYGISIDELSSTIAHIISDLKGTTVS